MTDIAERHSEVEAKLNKLRAQRGAAVLDGEPFDNAELSDLEGEVASLAAAGDEQINRARAEERLEFEKRRSQLRKELAALEATRLGELQDMNTAARTLADTIGKHFDTVRQMAEVAHAISGKSAPTPLQAPAIALRLSARLSAVMSGITGYRHRLGHIEWLGSSMHRPSDNWRQEEEKILEGHLRPLIEEEEVLK